MPTGKPMGKGEATRQRIIAAAAPIFNQRGFEGASMQDLMQATGLEKGGLYRHFANKEELAAEALRYALAENIKLRTGHVANIPNAVDKLRELVRIFVETPSTIPGGCPLMNSAIDSDDGNEALRDIARKGVQAWRNRLCRIIEAGIHAREIHPSTDPRRIANTLIATLEGALMIARLENNRNALRDAQDTLEATLTSIAAT
ncbi:MAG: TetR/AcrR family transcriptional regulator [Acidobacteriaceae bacterium]